MQLIEKQFVKLTKKLSKFPRKNDKLRVALQTSVYQVQR